MDEELENILRQHHIEPASRDLAARIAIAARSRTATPRPSPWQALAELLKPAPVAAFACSLLLGLIAGQQLAATPTAPVSYAVPKISQNAGAFLYYNGEVL